MAVIKGVVVERRENGVVILTRSGRFRLVRMKKDLPGVGTEIQSREWGRDILWYGAAVAVLFFLMFQLALFMAPVAYFTVQENPGIKLGANRFGLVVKAIAMDKSGDNVLKQVSIKGRRIESALVETIDEAVAQGLFSASGRTVTLVVVPVNEIGERLAKSVVPSLEKSIKEEFSEMDRPKVLVDIRVEQRMRG